VSFRNLRFTKFGAISQAVFESTSVLLKSVFTITKKLSLVSTFSPGPIAVTTLEEKHSFQSNQISVSNFCPEWLTTSCLATRV